MLIVFNLILFLAFSQQENESSPNALSITTGPILPSSIRGIIEIQSSWGLRYAIGASNQSFYELGLQHSNSNGDKIYQASLSAKTESSVEAMYVQLYAGLDYTMVKPTNSFGEALEEEDGIGGHIGSALLIPISKTSLFRSDMKFTANPGSMLYIGFGFEKRFSSDDADNNR